MGYGWLDTANRDVCQSSSVSSDASKHQQTFRHWSVGLANRCDIDAVEMQSPQGIGVSIHPPGFTDDKGIDLNDKFSGYL